MAQGAWGMVYGRNIYQHDEPEGCGRCADGDDPRRAEGGAAWGIYASDG